MASSRCLKRQRIRVAAALAIALLPSIAGAVTGPFSVLHHFNGHDGQQPETTLVVVHDRLIGTASAGGLNAVGTMFSMNLDGSQFEVSHTFDSDDGTRHPAGGLFIQNSRIFGTTRGTSSSSGSFYSIGVDGTGFQATQLPVEIPRGALAFDGETFYGSSRGDWGSLYSIKTDGSDFQMLHEFDSDGPRDPYGGVILIGSKLYGTTPESGPDMGVVYSIDTDGTDFSILHPFNFNDGRPVSGLTWDGSRLYGTTDRTIFSMQLDGSDFETMHIFQSGHGTSPRGALLVDGTRIYGTTSGGFSSNQDKLFSINTDGTGFRVLHHFGQRTSTSLNTGEAPLGTLIKHGSVLYGSTYFGGLSDLGVVFAFDLSVPFLGDLNRNGYVEIFDVGIVSENWLETGAPGIEGDANEDGIVNIFDIGVITENWLPDADGASVPEPATWVLFACGLTCALALVRRRS